LEIILQQSIMACSIATFIAAIDHDPSLEKGRPLFEPNPTRNGHALSSNDMRLTLRLTDLQVTSGYL
jgi:hypothetical protein